MGPYLLLRRHSASRRPSFRLPAGVSGAVVLLPHHAGRQVVLARNTAGLVRIVKIVPSVAEVLHQLGGSVAKVGRDGFAGSLPGPCECPAPAPVEAVRLGTAGQVDGGLCQREFALRGPEEAERVPCRHGHGEGARVGEADVLDGHAHEPARDVHRVLAGVEHASEPVQGGVGVPAADGLVERRDMVVVLVPGLVVDREAPLNGGLHDFQRQSRTGAALQLHRPLQDPERAPRVSVGGLGNPANYLAGGLDCQGPKPPLRVRKRVPEDDRQLFACQRLEDHDWRPGQERTHDLEARVLRGRADEDDIARLHHRQEGVLLGLVEAMDLVAEEDGPAPGRAAPRPRLGDDLPHSRDPLRDRAEGDEGGVRTGGDQPGQSRLPAPRRPPQDEAGDLAALDHRPQGAAGSHDLRLSAKLVEGPGPHARGERCAGTGFARPGGTSPAPASPRPARPPPNRSRFSLTGLLLSRPVLYPGPASIPAPPASLPVLHRGHHLHQRGARVERGILPDCLQEPVQRPADPRTRLPPPRHQVPPRDGQIRHRPGHARVPVPPGRRDHTAHLVLATGSGPRPQRSEPHPEDVPHPAPPRRGDPAAPCRGVGRLPRIRPEPPAHRGGDPLHLLPGKAQPGQELGHRGGVAPGPRPEEQQRRQADHTEARVPRGPGPNGLPDRVHRGERAPPASGAIPPSTRARAPQRR